jgi:hypothetical protein
VAFGLHITSADRHAQPCARGGTSAQYHCLTASTVRWPPGKIFDMRDIPFANDVDAICLALTTWQAKVDELGIKTKDDFDKQVRPPAAALRTLSCAYLRCEGRSWPDTATAS